MTMSTPKDKITMEPGIYDGLSYAEYDKIDAIRGSYLKHLENVPADAKCYEEEEDRDETEALIIGRAAHTLCYEPEKFSAEWVVSGDCEKEIASGDRAGQPCGATGKYVVDGQWYCGRHAKESNDNRAVLSLNNFRIIQRIANNLLAHPTMGKLWGDDCVFEQTIVWKDEETGIMCKARPDHRLTFNNRKFIFNLKTCRSADEQRFFTHGLHMGYYMSAGMQIAGIEAITGKSSIEAYAFMAAEKKLSCRVELHEVDEDLLEWGMRQFHRLLRIESECRMKDSWPAWQNPGASLLIKPEWLQ